MGFFCPFPNAVGSVTRNSYTTDLTDMKWELIEPLLLPEHSRGLRARLTSRKSLTPFSTTPKTTACGAICLVISRNTKPSTPTFAVGVATERLRTSTEHITGAGGNGR